jgi:hypothetical protein
MWALEVSEAMAGNTRQSFKATSQMKLLPGALADDMMMQRAPASKFALAVRCHGHCVQHII